jgi:UDP-glucose:(heptosyl)LPS alpha-1,3-glucosyltransferase
MKVAFVIHDFDQNFGQGRYGVELARYLGSRCEFVVYANTFSAPGISNIRWVPVPAWRFNVVTTVFTFLAASERLLRRDRPDVIHAQGLTSWSADIITGHICNAARARSMATARRRAHGFIRLITPFERRFYQQRRASELIAISRCLADEIRDEYGWNRGVTVLHHGTNTEQFRPAHDAAERAEYRRHFRLPDGRWTWLFMGEAVKGLKQVIDQLPHFPNAHLLAITRSDAGRYQSQARQLGVLDRISFWGYEPQPELAFRAADVFVYPNDYDPFGMVGSEAMASGMAVVFGRTIGVAELVEHGVNGLLCSPGNPTTIQDQLRRLESDRALGHRLGLAARQTILGTSWEPNSDAVFRLYEKVHARRSGARA